MQRTTTSMEAAEQPKVDRSLETTLRQFTDAFNRFDAREVASFWADDGTLLNPIGNFGRGRSEVERVFREDAETILAGSTSRFTITSARPVGSGHVLLDCDHDVANWRQPDGTRGHVKLHLVVLARRDGDRWQWLDARPYRIMDRPPRVH
jgi:uncharacterized protein (TIGR02246 family)